MQTVDREYIESHEEEIVKAIRKGSIFIYPTDTIYGLGCNAKLHESVQRIRKIKQREQKPFSVIAPSKEWILENCKVKMEDLNKYLPGPYTLFVERKTKAVADSVNAQDATLGVRIPNHWFAKVIEKVGVPFVTTSVNVTGEKYMTQIEDVSSSIAEQVDYCVYEGPKTGEPSTKIDLVHGPDIMDL